MIGAGKRGGEPDRLSFLYADHLPLVDVLHHREAVAYHPVGTDPLQFQPVALHFQYAGASMHGIGMREGIMRIAGLLTAQLTGGATHYINSTLVAAGLVLDIRSGIIAAII